MTVTNQFFIWFFYGLGGLGGWFLFLLLALVADIWLLYDSSQRRVPAVGWKIAAFLISAMILPAILYRFTVDPLNPLAVSEPLYPYSEPIFYLGLLAGVLPPVLAIGYFVTYQGMMGCPQGHLYEARLGQCPECARRNVQPPVVVAPAPVYQPPYPPQPVAQPVVREAVPPPTLKPKAQAWLVTDDGRNYQLNLGETTVGRSSSNDIQLSGDTTIHRQHVKILEQNGHFKIIDLGAKNNTRVNGHVVRQPVLLEPDDEIQLGDDSHLRFVTMRR